MKGKAQDTTATLAMLFGMSLLAADAKAEATGQMDVKTARERENRAGTGRHCTRSRKPTRRGEEVFRSGQDARAGPDLPGRLTRSQMSRPSGAGTCLLRQDGRMSKDRQQRRPRSRRYPVQICTP